MRVEGGDFIVDRSFGQDELERAKIFLEDTKTPQGRLLIAQGKDRATLMVSEIERLAAEFVMEGRCTLNHAIDSYLRAYVTSAIDCGVDKVQQTAKAASARLNHCQSIRISFIKLGFVEPSGPLAGLREMSGMDERVGSGGARDTISPDERGLVLQLRRRPLPLLTCHELPFRKSPSFIWMFWPGFTNSPTPSR